jgi:endo-alpha-1,4-polygalactosaminidase (GH114 family)
MGAKDRKGTRHVLRWLTTSLFLFPVSIPAFCAPALGPAFNLGPAGSLTTNSGEVISGAASVKGAYSGSDSYTPYLLTDPSVISFVPGHTYRVTFRYRILSAPSKGFEVLFLSGTAAAQGNFLPSTVVNGPTGSSGSAELTNTLGAYTDYHVRWNIVGTGAIAVDDVVITDMGTGQAVATEGVDAVTPPAIDLAQVRSYLVDNAASVSRVGIGTIASTPYDLLILGGADIKTPLGGVRAKVGNSKIMIAYIDTVEAASYWEPSLFAGGALSPLLGRPNPCCDGLYSVRYWDPAWRPFVFQQIDDAVAAGYDGVFLDVLDGHNQWTPGNSLGNLPYGDATSALASLVADIRAHVDSLRLGRPFYIIGNNPEELGMQFPPVLANLDVVFHEWIFWAADPNDSSGTTHYKGTGKAEYVRSFLAPLLKDKVVFGNDYPNPPTNPDAAFQSFAAYSALGWLPSVTYSPQDDRVFSSGPFMYTARSANPSVTGSKGARNFLSGGTASAATLIGGDQGDFFIGGPARNTIVGGAGDDTIYAHPASAALKNTLAINFIADVRNVPLPALSVRINGQPVLGPIAVSATFQNNEAQSLAIDIRPYAPLSTIEIAVTGTPYSDPTHYSNVQLQTMTFEDLPVSFALGQYSPGNGVANTTAVLNPDGKVIFQAAAFPANPLFHGNADTRDTIDGGAGNNTVVYRGRASDYTLSFQADGSLFVSTNATLEGPDTLRHIQWLKFSDALVSVADAASAPPTVVEYYNADLNNYFITADATEQTFVDTGAVGRWERTGNTFKTGGPNAVCRFYGNANVNPATGLIFGPNSHFYTADQAECAAVKAQYAADARSWKFESNDFLTTPAASGTCPAALVPVYRAYNNGFARGVDSNHRITASLSAYRQAIDAGWSGEGVVMCAPQ